MTTKDRKVSTIALAMLLVLVASGSANALTITGLNSWFDTTSYTLTSHDLNLSGWSYDESSKYTSFLSGLKFRYREGGGTTHPVPEPSAALVFGLGLLIASRFARRTR